MSRTEGPIIEVLLMVIPCSVGVFQATEYFWLRPLIGFAGRDLNMHTARLILTICTLDLGFQHIDT